jgi:uncharacterized protein (DUF1697 family)
MNANMAELRGAFESAGFDDVKSVLASGNLVFGANSKSFCLLEQSAEKAMKKKLGHSFLTIVRAIDELEELLERDPFKSFRLSAGAKRVVSFLRHAPKPRPALPIERDGARILALEDLSAFSAYVPSPRGPVFMTLIEKAFGQEVTTRTWDTVRKVVAAATR